MSDNGWISVDDKLPMTGQKVLVLIERCKDCGILIGLNKYYVGIDLYRGSVGWNYILPHEVVRMWMPIPEIPFENEVI